MQQNTNIKDKIYGIHAVLEALEAGTSLHKVYIQKDMHNDRIREIINKLKQYEIPFQLVPKEKMNRLTSKPHQGVVALTSAVEYQSIENILPQIFENGETPLIVVLDGVTDVRNIGAIARSAECFGVHAIVTPAQGSAIMNADAVKSSAGALHRLPVTRELNFLKSIHAIKNSGLQLVACTEKSKVDIDKVDFSIPTAIILGSEGEGIDPELLKLCDVQARIPMVGQIQSLNVSVAAGVIFYEAMKGKLTN